MIPKMKRKIFTVGAIAGFLVAGIGLGQAQTLDAILKVNGGVNKLAQASQGRIEKIADQTSDMLDDYRVVLKQIETLRAYNAQIEKLIRSQNKEIASLSSQINNVTVIDRQITPLMARMIDSLEEFVSLDVPFLKDERTDRMEQLRTIMDRSDIANSEKFRRLLEAFQIENNYGRTIEDYRGELERGGQTRSVDYLRIGRLLLFYQTLDRKETGIWDNKKHDWVLLSDSYRAPILNGLRMARKQKAPDLLRLPVPAPENAQ